MPDPMDTLLLRDLDLSRRLLRSWI